MSIAQRLNQIRSRIAEAAAKAGRDPRTVRLVAVSKTRPPEDIVAACRAGQVIFGENYVQELTAKAAGVAEPLEWHFIGHLQSNKVKYLAGLVTLVHSVDRLSLAEEISRQWGRLGRCCDVLVQVNIAGEASKSGTTETGALQLVRDIALLPNVKGAGVDDHAPLFRRPRGGPPLFCGTETAVGFDRRGSRSRRGDGGAFHGHVR